MIKESSRLLSELFGNLVGSNKLVEVNGTGEINRMDVTALREELDKANLQLDGSRGVLIERMNDHREDQGQGIVMELLDIATNSKKFAMSVEIDRMDVTTLREEIDKASLQMDGSRELLIDQLNANHERGCQDSE